MRAVPDRPWWAQLLTALAAMIGGPLLGLQMASALAPGSEVTQILGVLGFAAVLVAGAVLWMGLGIVTVVAGGLWKLVRGRSLRPEGLAAGETMVPPGYKVFLVLGPLFGGFVGLSAGLLSDLTVISAVAIWTGAGFGYGAALWLAAHHGYLPFPEPE